MPWNPRQENKRHLKACINLLENMDTHVGQVYSSYPDEHQFDKWRESMILIVSVKNQLSDLISSVEEIM
jgi:hypothetical protein